MFSGDGTLLELMIVMAFQKPAGYQIHGVFVELKYHRGELRSKYLS